MNAYSKTNMKKRFLITGINGQIGRGIVKNLYSIYGLENVFGTDIKQPTDLHIKNFHILNVTEKQKLRQFIIENKINNIIHLATLRSHDCENNLELAKKVNIDALHNIFEISKESNLM